MESENKCVDSTTNVVKKPYINRVEAKLVVLTHMEFVDGEFSAFAGGFTNC